MYKDNKIGRFDKISVSGDSLPLSAKVPWPVTIKEGWLDSGMLIVPIRLSLFMAGTNTVHVLYDEVDEVLPFEEKERLIEGLSYFYSSKAMADRDTVHLQLQGLNPTHLFAYSSWKKELDELIGIRFGDFDWGHHSLRDCIIVIMARCKRPVHYKDIYLRMALYKEVTVDLIVETLNRYSPFVFTEVSSGMWQFSHGNN